MIPNGLKKALDGKGAVLNLMWWKLSALRIFSDFLTIHIKLKNPMLYFRGGALPNMYSP